MHPDNSLSHSYQIVIINKIINVTGNNEKFKLYFCIKFFNYEDCQMVVF